MKKFKSRLAALAMLGLVTTVSVSTVGMGITTIPVCAAKKKHHYSKINTSKDAGYENCLYIAEYDIVPEKIKLVTDPDVLVKFSATKRKDTYRKLTKENDETFVTESIGNGFDDQYEDESVCRTFYLEDLGFKPGDLITIRAYHKISGVYSPVPYAAKRYQLKSYPKISRAQARKYYQNFLRAVPKLYEACQDPNLPGREYGTMPCFYSDYEWDDTRKGKSSDFAVSDKISGTAFFCESKKYIRHLRKYYKVTYTVNGTMPTYHSKELKYRTRYSYNTRYPLCVFTYRKKGKKLIGVSYYGLRRGRYSSRLR